jgi:S-adenosylmethionine-diacylglycerol 3-amino-3-carboxypropyl transferase
MSSEKLCEYKKQLSYSTCNEDSLSELKALNINNEDTVICITGSGGRTLNLLTAKPKRIISVDFCSIQNYLLELKMAAIKSLTYADYCKFLGLKDSDTRLNVYNDISKYLSSNAKDFWDHNRKMISKGVIYQGKFEKHYLKSSNFIKLFRRNKVKKIFSFTNLEEQRKFYHEKWDNKLWNLMLTLDANSSNYKRTIKDPAYFLYVDKNFDYKQFFHESLKKAFTKGLANENHFLGLTIDGTYKNVTKLPLYLREENYQILKNNLDRIEVITDSLENYMKGLPDQTIDKFSISDVSGYLNENEYEDLLRSMIRVAKNKGRFCYRNFIAKKGIPEVFKGVIARIMVWKRN